MTQVPPPPGAQMRPHRGTMILIFGILGFFCFVFGIVAWVMGNQDLREMDAGRMDPSGRSTTQVGRILGIVWVALFVLSLVVGIILTVLAPAGP